MSDFLSPAGPIFGPNFVIVAVEHDGSTYQLQVYPDANNVELEAAGRPTQYYWQPARVYLAHKQESPGDYDFGMTVFRGLMTSEDTIGVQAVTGGGGGELEVGGGFCTFSTTFAVPNEVIESARQKLRDSEHSQPEPWMAHLFPQWQNGRPEPLLGIVPILNNDVTIEVPNLAGAAAGTNVPMFIEAQGAGKGSIEAQGFSSFLVTCNQFATGAITGAFENGKSPFTIHCTLREQVYIHACQAKITVDVDKCYEQFSGALDAGGFLGIGEASLQYAYSNMVTNGGVVIELQMDEANLTPELEDWIKKNVDDMKATAYQLLKEEIFDWKPREDAPATAERGLFSSIFGGCSVSLKASYQKRSIRFDQTLKLDTSIAVSNTIVGDLSDLLPAVKADKDKYVSVVNIAEYFRKIQVAAKSAIKWGDANTKPERRDPLVSVSLAVAYPDDTAPRNADGTFNLNTHVKGDRYVIGGGAEASHQWQDGVWTSANPNDVVNFSFLKPVQPIEGWPEGQVQLTKTLAFDGSDSRVDLANGSSQVEIVELTSKHDPTLAADQVGYVGAQFMLSQAIPTENVTMTLTVHLADRTDQIEITAANQKDVFWELYSDKYLDVTEFSWELEVMVSPPTFGLAPITYKTAEPTVVPLGAGRVKNRGLVKVNVPPAPADQAALVGEYVSQFPSVV